MDLPGTVDVTVSVSVSVAPSTERVSVLDRVRNSVEFVFFCVPRVGLSVKVISRVSVAVCVPFAVGESVSVLPRVWETAVLLSECVTVWRVLVLEEVSVCVMRSGEKESDAVSVLVLEPLR